MNDKQDERAETFVVYGAYYWGKGKTLPEAKKQFQKSGGHLSDGYTVLLFDADTIFDGVDGMGRYSYRHRDGVSKPTEPIETIHQGRVHSPYGRGTSRRLP